LEFPVVFLAAAERGFRNRDEAIRPDSALGVALKARDTETMTQSGSLSFAAFTLKNNREEREELLRLLYVATTRARYHLVITGEKAAPAKKDAPPFRKAPDECSNFMDWIESAANRNREIYNYYARDDAPALFVEPPKTVLLPEREKPVPLAFSYPHAAAESLHIKYTVTGLNTLNKLQGGRKENENENLVSQNIETGNIYHKLMELIDFETRTKSGAEAQIEALRGRGLLPPGEIDAERVAALLSSPLFEEIRRGKIRREQPFLLYLPACEVLPSTARDKVLIQGVIDLLSLGKQNILADYKISGAPPREIKERYLRQLNTYALAAERLLGIRIHKKLIFILNRGLVLEVE
jgi:ATP-dependent exoDNAse (exonuclease V) beta subunit